jgi:hypothetical protein
MHSAAEDLLSDDTDEEADKGQFKSRIPNKIQVL